MLNGIFGYNTSRKTGLVDPTNNIYKATQSKIIFFSQDDVYFHVMGKVGLSSGLDNDNWTESKAER
jgi:hypothetical protein